MSGDEARPRLDALTSLRFFAAAMIVTLHGAGRGLGPDWSDRFALHQGVSFFYVLSGFVLAYTYPRLPDARAVRAFYVARIARIWPLHLAVAGLLVLLIGNVSYFNLPEGRREIITAAFLTMTQAWVPLTEFITAYNPVSWSISTEWFFYLAFPLLIAGWPRTGTVKLLAMLGVAAGMWWLAERLAVAGEWRDARTLFAYIHPLARIFEFTLGIATCHVYRQYGGSIGARLRGPRATLVEIAVLVLAVATLWSSRALSASPSVASLLGATGAFVINTSGFGSVVWAALVLVFAIGAGAVTRALSVRPLVFLGEASFALYLVHPAFLLYLDQTRVPFAGLAKAELLAVYWAVVLVTAAVLHLGVEKPCQQLIRAWHAGRLRPILPRLAATLAACGALLAVGVTMPPSARDASPTALAPPGRKLLPEPVDFGSYRLERIEVLPATAEQASLLRFSWTALQDVPVGKRVGVHLLDGNKRMVGQLAFVMETGFRRAAAGDRWSNLVAFANPAAVAAARSLGVAVLEPPGLVPVRTRLPGTSDWGGKRLLVRMDPAQAPPASAPRAVGAKAR